MVAAPTPPPALPTGLKPSAGSDNPEQADVREDDGRAGKDGDDDDDGEEKHEAEEEVVAVGSVAHVVQRAFRAFYSSTNDASKESAAASSGAAAPSRESQPSAEAPAQQAEVAAASEAAASSPTGDTTAAASDAPASVPGPSGSDDEASPHAADVASNPFVQLGSERKRAIAEELRDERLSANRLLKFLEERHADAKRADDAVEEQLRLQGLVMKDQIPLGPSPLRLDAREVDSPAFGAFSAHLLHAKSIVADYHQQRLERSGNAPSRTRQRAPGQHHERGDGDGERSLGYLDSTHSAAVRTDATLKMHERRIAGVKTFHAASNGDGSSSSSNGGSAKAGSSDVDDKSGDREREAATAGSPTRRTSSQTAQPRTAKRSEPDTMPMTDQRANMAILSRMQTKLDFLRNPRHAEAASASANGSGSGNGSGAPEEPHSFSVDPRPPVTFSEYDIGGVYEQTLFVRNRTALSRRLRVLPPATLFFSVAEVAFPDPSGLVAPGMHVQVRLRFSPDSRADYRDTLTVQYESAAARGGGSAFRELAVPLAARREPPELSIPLVLRARNTLVGDSSRTEIPCRNAGGPGTFWLMTEREWTRFEAEAAFRGAASASSSAPAAAMAAAELTAHVGAFDASESLRAGPFRLSPTRVALRKGEATTLVLDYAPSSVGECRERIVMVCDNCLVRVFQLVGRSCQVELAVTGVNSAPIDRSIEAMGTLTNLFFPPDVLVDSCEQQTVTVANDTPIDVRYSWRIAPAAGPEGTAPASVHAEEPPFRVVPASGVFPQSSSLAFSVVFSPTRPANNFRFAATLMAQDVPACSLPGRDQGALLAAAAERNRQHEAEGGASETNRCESAVEALAIDLDGGAALGAFAIDPAVWDFTSSVGLLQKDAAHVARVTLRNESAAPVRFQWDSGAWRRRNSSSSPPFTLSVSPSEGTLAPSACQSVAIELTPHCVGPFSIPIRCSVPTVGPLEDPSHAVKRSLLLVGDVARAQVRVLSPEVDFGLVLAGGSAEASIEIGNTSPSASADWKLVHLLASPERPVPPSARDPRVASKMLAASHPLAPTPTSHRSDRSGSSALAAACDNSPTSTVTFAPESGRLGPGERLIIRAKCLAGALPERFRATLACQVAAERAFPPELAGKATVSAMGSAASSMAALGGSTCLSSPWRSLSADSDSPPSPRTAVYVSARAEIQSPKIFLSTTEVSLGTTYLGMSVRRSVELINISNLEASFKFVDPDATAGVRPYTLELTPKAGRIRSKERLEIAITYTARQPGRFAALIACNVRGLPAPLGFRVTSVHKGLILSYELAESPAAVTALPSPLQPSASTDSVATVADTAEGSGSALVPPTPPRLAFGDNVPLGERRALYLLVRNLSGIDAVIDLEPKRFPVGVADGDGDESVVNSLASPTSTTTGSASSRKAPARAGSGKKNRARKEMAGISTVAASTKGASARSRAMLLSNAHEYEQRLQSESGRAYIQKRAEALEDRRVLQHGRGVAFRLEPTRVRVAPWGHSIVRVVCFNNKPGTYADEIVSRASGLVPVMLPVTVTVTGAPLVLDRNCVGLFFPRTPAAAAGTPRQPKTKAKHKSQTPGPDCPTLRFGQVCVRSQTPMTRALRVVNRSPQPARVTWRLTPPGRENHLVALSLRVDFAARVQVRISPREDWKSSRRRGDADEDPGEDENECESPFAISPPFAVVAPFAAASFRVTLRPSSEVAMHRFMLVADAKWQDERHSGASADAELASDDSSDGDADAPRSDPHSAAHTAAGKAIAAVRAANTFLRPPSRHSTDAEAVSSAKSCVRVLLAADLIEPELFLDRSKRTDGGGDALYHVTFTTWSTVVSANASASASAAAATHEFHRRELQLVNHLQAPLTFRLECAGPFVVFRAESLAPKHPLSLADLPPAHRRAQGESFMFSLPPEMAVRLELRFDPSLMAAPLAAGQPANRAVPRQLRALVEGALLVRFANQSVQTIRLAARVLQPMLVVSPATHTFGRVHVTRRRAVTLRVANPTVVPAQFVVEHVPLPVPLSRAQKHEFARHHARFADEPAVFVFSVTSGIVPGPTLPLRSAGGLLPSGVSGARDGIYSPLAIDVSFRPRDAGKHYRSRFRLAVTLGHAFEVELQGVGHLDEYEVDDQERPAARVTELTHSNRIFTRL